MSPNELDTLCVPFLFDLQQISYSKTNQNSEFYSFPSMLNPSYENIHEKEIIIADIGTEFIIFINS